MSEELRRVDDERYTKLEVKIDRVSTDVGAIRDMLISEPEASPMGRALIKRSNDNRMVIQELRGDFEKYVEDHQDWVEGFIEKRFDPMYDWWNQTKGAWRVVIGLGVVLGCIGSFFGILSFFGLGH